MSNVVAKVTGGQPKDIEGACSVEDVRKTMGLSDNHEATVNGEPATDKLALSEGDYVIFSEKVKGGQ